MMSAPPPAVASSSADTSLLQSRFSDVPDVPSVSRDFRSSPRRFWVLLVATALALTNGSIWNTFAPISVVAEPFFGWTDSTLALLANWGAVCYLLAAAPSAHLLDVHGLRTASVASAALMLAGSLLRCVHVVRGSEASSLLMHAGQVINGLAGPIAMSIGPVVSAQWFPPHERTAATALIATSNYGGTALAFVLGPWLVPAKGARSDDAARLRAYFLSEAIVTGVLLLACMSLPACPTANGVAASRTAGQVRVTLCDGRRLRRSLWRLRRVAVWALGYALVPGCFGAWGAMLGPNLASFPGDETQQQAGWIGFWGAVAGIGGGLALSAYADAAADAAARGGTYRPGRKKALLVGAIAISTVAFATFALACAGCLPLSAADRQRTLYAASIVASLFANGTVPLFFELAVEAAFPVAEGLVTTVLTVGLNAGLLLVLGVASLTPSTSWMNWAVVATCALALGLIAPITEPHARDDVDRGGCASAVVDIAVAGVSVSESTVAVREDVAAAACAHTLRTSK